MESFAIMKKKPEYMTGDASCESNLRLCAQNRRCLYEWLLSENDKNVLLLDANDANIMAEKLQQKEKYDVVILDDVLGYTKEVEKLMDMSVDALKDTGKLVITVANRIGIQTLAGKLKDYVGYSKQELQEIIKEDYGFGGTKIFYPYPDQNYMKEVFAEDALIKYQYGRPYINTTDNRFVLFDENKFANTLVREDAIDILANAFMLVATKQMIKEVAEIEYVKLNWDREERFRIATVVKNTGIVEKYALNEKARGHIERLYNCQDMSPCLGAQNLPGEYTLQKMCYPLLTCNNLDTLIAKEIENANKEGIFALFDKFYQKLFEKTEYTQCYITDEFKTVFGEVKHAQTYHCANPMNVDLICDNVFCCEDKYIIIDCEWIFDFLIPVEFVVWRAISELYGKHTVLYDFMPKREFFEHYSITPRDEENFEAWGVHFAYEYVKSDSVRNLNCKQTQITLAELYEDHANCEIFKGNQSIPVQDHFEYDMGSGFEKGNVVSAKVEQSEEAFRIVAEIPKKINGKILKWNPAVYPCTISLKELRGIRIIGHNANETDDEGYQFFLGDAFFYFVIDNDCTQIMLDGEISHMTMCEQREIVAKRDLKKQTEIEELQKELDEVKAEKVKLQNDLDSVLNSTIWRKTEFLRQLKDGKCSDAKSETTPMADETAQPQQLKPIRESIHFCVDEAKIADGMMSIDGWILCEYRKITSSYLILEDVAGVRRQYPFKLRERDDVASALGLVFEGNCGVHIDARYKSYCQQKIIFKVQIENEWVEVATDAKVPVTYDAVAGEIYFERYSVGEDVVDYLEFEQNHLATQETLASDWKVDVVVPVYNGFQYLADLFASIEKTTVDYRLILVEDCSPDEKVRPYLENYASTHEHVILLKNEENLGFVKSVNKALRMTENHVALVNTDVIVPEGWLERLMAPIFNCDDIASTTPFTNSGTIYSFPNFAKDNALFMGLSVDEIDAEFARIKPRYIEAPTGVGFCMGMSQRVVREIGILDEETFEKGYGEENDWCQRAINAGYKNVYVENLFVHHNHGGSFPSETKQRLLRENAQKLAKKHPNYNDDVAKFLRMDPNADIREYIKFELMYRCDKSCILAFDHDLGGGASVYLKQKMSAELSEGKMFVIVRYNLNANQYFVSVYCGEYEAKIMLPTRKDVVQMLEARKYEQIWINELATYVELEEWFEDLRKLREERAQSMRLLLHDYFMICPSLNLMSPEGKYCRIPQDTLQCEACLQKNDYTYYEPCKSVETWRNAWKALMKQCDEIIAFSKDTIRIMKEVYPEVEDIQLIPHVVEPIGKIEREKKTTATVNVGVLGAISEQKGLHVIKKMLRYIEEQNINMKIVIIGECSEEIESSAFCITGKYERKDIPELTLQYDIDAFLIPSIWPETFSYTTSEIMSMDMPIAVFNLGAPVERVQEYSKGLILGDPDMDVAELVQTLYKFAQNNEKCYNT